MRPFDRQQAQGVTALRELLDVGVGHLFDRQAELVGQRRHPRQHVGQLGLLLLARALAHRLRQLADLLGQPRHGGRQATRRVALAVGAGHEALQLAEIHRPAP
jgi:hypothetical protein